eukprot:363771-Chlamydomonas_euryale.AAC.6
MPELSVLHSARVLPAVARLLCHRQQPPPPPLVSHAAPAAPAGSGKSCVLGSSIATATASTAAAAVS